MYLCHHGYICQCLYYSLSENEASKLHFRRPRCECCHLTETISLVVVGERFRVVPESPCLTGVVDIVRSLPVLLALLNCCRIFIQCKCSLIHRFSSKFFVTIKTHCVSKKKKKLNCFICLIIFCLRFIWVNTDIFLAKDIAIIKMRWEEIIYPNGTICIMYV